MIVPLVAAIYALNAGCNIGVDASFISHTRISSPRFIKARTNRRFQKVCINNGSLCYNMGTKVYSSNEAASSESSGSTIESNKNRRNTEAFDMRRALFCGGLAFDTYSEPPSYRIEKGPQGLNVAFVSSAYTRTLYSGLLEISPLIGSDLPTSDPSAAESVLSGGGIDPYLLVAVAEGRLKDDIDKLKQEYNAGVLDLKESSHVGRSSTAWSNVDERKAKRNLKQGGSGAYSIPGGWTKGAQSVWKDDPPFHLYVQEPKDAYVVLTVMDENLVGEDFVVGSAYKRLRDLIPTVKEDDIMNKAKNTLIEKLKLSDQEQPPNEQGLIDDKDIMELVVQEWEGDIKLQAKPRKKDKGGQVTLGVVAGAAIAGPAGAAVGGLVGNLYEGKVRGKVRLRLRYVPVPKVNLKRERYQVKGGLPGVAWGELYSQYISKLQSENPSNEDDIDLAGNDLELCAYVNHEKTGCSCAVYRSLEKRLIAVSFRGTCQPIDLLTDASIAQTPWVEGVEVKDSDDFAPMVHTGFRNSLNSIARRLKELILAAVAPSESLSQYDLLVTGHSLGGALATLFTADVAEFGMDAGRALPQLEPSAPWWISLTNNFFMSDDKDDTSNKRAPPRPKSLRLYSFGSPRVGNQQFVDKFESLLENKSIDQAYRVVNNADIVARLPRTVNALVFGTIGYEHCGATALIALPKIISTSEQTEGESGVRKDEVKIDLLGETAPLLWIEGESNDDDCPVRDGTPLTSPLAEGALLGDLFVAVKNVTTSSDQIFAADDKTTLAESIAKNESLTMSMASDYVSKLGTFASKLTESVSGRLQSFTMSDLSTVVGIDKKYAERESKLIQSVFSGEGLAHHMENEYYVAMGRACGFISIVGKEIKAIDDVKSMLKEGEVLDMVLQQPRESGSGEGERRGGQEEELVAWDAKLENWEGEKE